MTRLLLAVLASIIAGCGASTGPDSRDAGPADASSMDGSTVDAPSVDASISDVGTADAGGPRACGSSTCGPGQICITGRCAGCCDVPPACIPIPGGCSGALACGCFTADPCGGCTTCQAVTADEIVCGNCMCMCSPPWSPIATPGGPRPIADLRVGELVYSLDRGAVVIVPVARVNRTAVTNHALVRVTLAGGDVVEMSGGHPTADGHRFDSLVPGARLGDAEIVSVETVPYDEPFTYDILPASDSGTYFVGDAWIGSTLFPPAM